MFKQRVNIFILLLLLLLLLLSMVEIEPRTAGIWLLYGQLNSTNGTTQTAIDLFIHLDDDDDVHFAAVAFADKPCNLMLTVGR